MAASGPTVRWRMARWWRLGLSVLVLGFALFEAVAYRHARAMMTFTPSGERTPTIEALSRGQKLRILLTGVQLPKPANFRLPQDVGLVATTNLLVDGQGPLLESWVVSATNSRGTVALFHGYADCKASQLGAARAFRDLGFDCWLTDFRGHGGSEGHTTSFGFHEAQDVRRVVAHLEAQGARRPLLLFGVSMGGAAALRAVADLGVTVDGLVVVSTYDRMIDAVRCRFHSMGVPAFPAAESLVFWGGVQQDMNGFRLDPVDFARRVACPTLVLHGALDPRAPLAQGSNIYQQLAGPKSMVVFASAGHESLVAKDPVLWRARMAFWLDQVVPR